MKTRDEILAPVTVSNWDSHDSCLEEGLYVKLEDAEVAMEEYTNDILMQRNELIEIVKELSSDLKKLLESFGAKDDGTGRLSEIGGFINKIKNGEQ